MPERSQNRSQSPERRLPMTDTAQPDQPSAADVIRAALARSSEERAMYRDLAEGAPCSSGRS